jgi:hypothetical protein
VSDERNTVWALAPESIRLEAMTAAAATFGI